MGVLCPEAKPKLIEIAILKCTVKEQHLAARLVGAELLANLLPGIRDLRGPLTVGYMWLLNLWLLFADDVPRERPSNNDVVAKLFDLGNLVGATVVLAAVSFVAYMIGSLLFVNPEGRLWEAFWVTVGKISPIQGLLPWRRDRTSQELSRWMDRQQEARYELNIAQLAAKLRVASADLYSDYDRLRSEAELRINVAPPLAVLSILLGLNLSRLYFIGVAISIVLVFQGLQRQQEGRSLVLQALMASVIKFEGP
jgi:hypothetical protein